MPTDDHALSRRAFLGIAGAAGALAACSPKALPQKLVPYLVPAEDGTPGTPLFYRTVCRECPAGCGVTARTREGRVVKLEGNADDPIGRGTLCARGQASLQGLYDPDRLRGPMRRSAAGGFEPATWDDALQALTDALVQAHDRGALRGLRLLSRPEPGMAGDLQKGFLKALGAKPAQRAVFEPLDLSSLREAGRLLFGKPELPSFDLSKARTVVSFGADFLETWLSPVELTRGFAAGRGKVGADRTRLTWVGPRRSATGGSADRWLRCRSGGEVAVALGLARWLTDPKNGVRGLPREAPEVFRRTASFEPDQVERVSDVARDRLEALARELAEGRPSALLGPGVASAGTGSTELALAVSLLNFLLGNVGTTVLYGLDPMEDPPTPPGDLEALFRELRSGQVDLLLVHHADPVGTLPRSSGVEAALAKVPLIVSFSDRLDATTRLAHWVLPDHHPLEAFGDVTPRRGVTALQQPVMRPLGDTRSASQVLLDLAPRLPFLAGKAPQGDLWDLLQARWTAGAKELGARGETLPEAVRGAQERGGFYSPVAGKKAPLSLAGLGRLSPRPPEGPSGTFALVAFPTALRHDGRSAHLPWLREVPDAVTTICGEEWAELSPAAAKKIGVEEGDVVEISTPAGSAAVAVYVTPGIRDDSIGLPLGGPSPLAVLSNRADPLSGGFAWAGARVSIRPTGRRSPFAKTEGSPEIPTVDTLLQTVSTEHPAVERAEKAGGMYPPPEFPKHRWVMSIDLDKCTGCQACVVACYAENNVPVVGPELIREGRHMAWLRIERLYEPGPEADVDFLPMLCQQCDNAPCEPVCPVYATYHTTEGLNAQIYNRCVGTRYCANNCPYKTRVFNYLDVEFRAPLNLQLNPDVSVRSKGVMEKCTFCVQRIRLAENAARDGGRPVRDGEVAPACVQTCPAQAITFGDARDPQARVNRLRSDPRGYGALEELNTGPAVTYLARVREKKA